ncbi:hypothetical protein A5731_23155 [Mycolicibacterium conceptionense]|jgi:hypothetical protein|uniref:Uncharacterized protein n=3 Tax=Mycolicibacterium conceptionense TaxID=451644 RepID=A0A0J8U4Y9_9MYCO|nr:hypothetical protein [Mycolicibacterium conceptionense]KMV16481.1 hypothetical protein ACT17_19920 [Mycolicibacterium conceptionense]OBB11431.1 hypothetical protein A5718_06520 [Mycolicibacterium conceptionense]OBE97688.1 hypothetical protein A5731_23155 [Mycolicibacterium conceptionense]OBF26620.1 hypothetical protein A5726_05480 [Mycolicibacterium conceptionense]OBF31134.1 hypothetical protein A5720_28655 [Mycolicibacterium conceptionense]
MTLTHPAIRLRRLLGLAVMVTTATTRTLRVRHVSTPLDLITIHWDQRPPAAVAITNNRVPVLHDQRPISVVASPKRTLQNDVPQQRVALYSLGPLVVMSPAHNAIMTARSDKPGLSDPALTFNTMTADDGGDGRCYFTAPAHLHTEGQLRSAGFTPLTLDKPAAWLLQPRDGELWRTGLYRIADAVPMHAHNEADNTIQQEDIVKTQLTVVWWTNTAKPPKSRQRTDYERRTKNHATIDGQLTRCGFAIPEQAIVVTPAADWHLHVNCYNCAYRLWPEYGPPGFRRPVNGDDFPPKPLK